MHYHLEIVMPPTDDIKAAVKTILAPFNEQGTDEDGEPVRNGFWDWWVIGGRFAGTKMQAKLDPTKLDSFQKALSERKVTVAGFTAGKQEISPASQIPMVDALWNEFFPESNGLSCPLFKHSNDQYKNDSLLPDDVTRFADVSTNLDVERVIFAAPDYKNEGLEAVFMLSRDFWNGVNHQKTDWDGTFTAAVDQFAAKRERYSDEYIARSTPQDDWLVVTVDYHT